jgi:hypothetical protein
MVDRKELIEWKGREGELIEADDINNPLIGCRRVKRCWIWGETVWGRPAVREKMIDRKELIKGRGREGELIEADDLNNPYIGCRRVKRCWIWGETLWGHPTVREKNGRHK